MTTQAQTILIIDDNPTNLAILFDALHDVGYKVLVQTNSTTALENIHHSLPDLILLDIVMPNLDGFETCRRLKNKPETQDIPIIFMTALSDMGDEIKGFELGAVDYITKPINVDTVLARINTHLTLRQLQQNLEAQNAELDAFAHTVAHDLKSPTGIIKAYSEILLTDKGDMTQDERSRIVKNLHQASQRVDNIIHELLLLAGVRKKNVQLQPLDMGQILHQVQERLEPMITQYQGELHLPNRWPQAVGYAPWLEEVWVNYISNGLKYGGSPPRLTLGARPNGNSMLRFWIQDQGAGIPPSAQEILFTEFSRLDEVKTEGYGLGLSIVRRIIHKLGGQVGVASTPGEGSTFYFTLPRAMSNEQ